MTQTPLRGHVAPGFEPVRDAFRANFEADEELGAGFAAWVGETCIIDLQGGWRDRDRTAAWTEDTLVPVFSTTKPVAALVIAWLLDRPGAPERGYETPVGEIWPEFAANGKADITLATLLSHQAGLAGFGEPIDPELWMDPPALAAALAEEAPMWPPGEGSGYHPLSWGYLAGEVARRLSGGRSLGTVLREEITHAGEDREDVVDFWIGLPEREHDRVAEMIRPRAMPDLGEMNRFKKAAFLEKWSAPSRGGADWKRIEILSASGHGTARATARLYGAYAGTLDIGLSTEIRDALLRSRSDGADRVLPFEIDFAAGVMRNTHGLYGPNPASYGHSGWGGSMALGDPDRGLSMAYVMNRQSNKLQGDPRAQKLVEAVYDCL